MPCFPYSGHLHAGVRFPYAQDPDLSQAASMSARMFSRRLRPPSGWETEAKPGFVSYGFNPGCFRL